MTENEVAGRFFKNSNKYVTQYSYYLIYEEITNSKRTITKQVRVGCTYPKTQGHDSFLFTGFWNLTAFDDKEETFSETTKQEWERQMVKSAIKHGSVNDADFFEVIKHIK